MTDYDDGNEFETDVDEAPPAEKQNWRKALEADAKAGKAAQAEAAAAKRELAFLKAGVDLDTPLGKVFAKGYDGELTADALKAAFAEVNGPPAPPAAPDLSEYTRMANTVGGGESPDEYDQAHAAITAPKWTDAGNVESVLAAFVAAGGRIDSEAPGRWLDASPS